jgi:hypothetical protein
MKAKSIVLTLTLCFVVAVVCLAAHLQLGTWKLNESKSKLDPNRGKNHTVVYAAEGDNVKITVDGVDRNGKATHNEWTGKFDGKDYPVTGDPDADMRSYKVVDDQTLAMTVKKGDKITVEGSIVISADGKTRTITLNGTDSEGNQFSSTAVYDKQ